MRLTAILAVFFLFQNYAVAQKKVGCPPREMLMQSLKDADMVSVWSGWSDRGHITEIWMNMRGEDTRWLAVVHLPSNYSCVVDQGIKGTFQPQGKASI
ncbi:MAG: hypothetical protein CME70_17885 [Halobacteriovorax sp.]|nr:hypothetical protein [Halobacteriovorax sp.]|tara:strand:+ start:8814 stop:9107 length:294 start_codon:yes stop_codon:yes gene_type:complete